MTMEGKFVRAAYNNEGYVILGYQATNRSVGEEWMLLEVGMTVLRQGAGLRPEARGDFAGVARTARRFRCRPSWSIARATPRPIQNRAKVQRDSINYFPPSASRACRIGFFSDLASPAMPYDQVELSNTRACLGRLYFKVPGGITYGQYWLNVKFAEQPAARAVQDPDRGRGEAAVEELQGHQQAGEGRVQAEEVGHRGYRDLQADEAPPC